MLGVVNKPDTHQKLEILSSDAQYDLACACSSNKDERRHRSTAGDKWIYPVSLPNGGTSVLFKTLISNTCNNDCAYCPLRANQDVRRCSLSIDETVRAFLDYYNRKIVFGLFLSSGVIGSPDKTMQRLCGIAKTLRQKYRFRGYIHLKVIPGCSNSAIEEAVSLSSAVSLNIETPGEKYMSHLSNKKDFLNDVVGPIKLISKLTAKGNKFERVKQTTQFIVGAADETDADIVKYSWGLYDRLNLQRIYFSAYQKGLGEKSLPAEQKGNSNPQDLLTREHRLYQVDFLFRKYGFRQDDIAFNEQGRLSLDTDPKETWAKNHPEKFPLNVNRASNLDLLRVPGLGPVTVNRILKRRRYQQLRSIEDVGKVGKLLAKADNYLVF